MLKPTLLGTGLILLLAVTATIPFATIGHAQSNARVFELRTYTCNEGKLEALQKRFREHTTALFEKHGMTNIGYWVPQDPPRSQIRLFICWLIPAGKRRRRIGMRSGTTLNGRRFRPNPN